MGQAKLRAKEIAELKSRMVDLEILAIKHYPDSRPEMVHYNIQIPAATKNNRDHLLAYICQREWLHNPPAQAIAEYLLQTKSYEMFSQFNPDNGYIINFHKSDPDRPNTHSCRDIIATPREALKEMAHDMGKEFAQDSEYSVKQYA